MPHAPPADPSLAVPSLDPGLTLLRRPSVRSPALHHLAVSELGRRDGTAYWVDARNQASTHRLYDFSPSARRLDRLRIARAFTAHQHHSLVRSLPGRATSRTGLVVVPAVADLYRDPDVPGYEATRLLESTLAVLAATADALEVPVLVTASRDDDLASLVEDRADHRLEARETGMGLSFEGDEFLTKLYWRDGWFQTTVPYWVDLLGAVGDGRAGPAAGTGVLDLEA